MNLEHFKKQKLPDTPGVYFFLNNQKKILYIGKATSLTDRVRSYFSPDLIDTRGKLLVKMVDEATQIDFRETQSVLEALLLEADLIKKFKPTFNTKEKDDKSFNCVVITKEDFPRIMIIRKRDVLQIQNVKNGGEVNPKYKDIKIKTVFGPFINGMQLKEALKIIRKIFPYRDEKCHLNSKRPCFNYSIGLCPGTCIGVLDKHCYAIRIRRIEKFLSGDIKSVVKDLEDDMTDLAKEQKFEAAKILRDKIYALQHINDVSLIKEDSLLRNNAGLGLGFRIESYDIAHMSGKNMVGVMTVVTNGVADKNEYRKFKIKTVDSSNDTKALAEVLERRLTHPEWQMPNLIVVDGGVAQLNVMNTIIDKANLSIPVVSVLKDERHQPKDVLGDQTLGMKYRKEILLSNAEAHRFAIGYHKKMRRKNFLV
ncbi:MAG: GIY-YIG nuclease family protein [Patescibacteria group bacterium]